RRNIPIGIKKSDEKKIYAARVIYGVRLISGMEEIITHHIRKALIVNIICAINCKNKLPLIVLKIGGIKYIVTSPLNSIAVSHGRPKTLIKNLIRRCQKYLRIKFRGKLKIKSGIMKKKMTESCNMCELSKKRTAIVAKGIPFKTNKKTKA